MQTRSKSGIVKKKSFATSTTINYLQTEPPSFTIASKIPEWRAAMASEFDALQRQHTWSLIPPCSDQNLKAGVDFDETFSPVVKPPTVRIILSLAALNQWPLQQLDAPRAWFERFTSHLLTLGFTASLADASLFVLHHGSTTVYLLLYVDDIIITDNNSTAISDIISQLSAAFEIKDLGPLRYFLGLQIDYKKVRLFVHQHKYITDLLHKFQMTDCKAAPTPIATTPPLSTANNDALSDPTPFRSLVRCPSQNGFFVISRVHCITGVLFQPGPLALTAFTDADWAGDPSDRRSTSGVIVFLGHNPITWLAKKQHTVSRSSTEAEYRSLATGAAELAWLRQVLCDLKLFLPSAPLIWCDNTNALALASNPIFHGRTKHIEVDYHLCS
uniref:Reverse transcriptase Ty1/copia-type domain-containing protein n=1 Tax=Fagus sylvatica TaxID=28930 RepID=A0A2N9GMU5_FAGSY